MRAYFLLFCFLGSLCPIWAQPYAPAQAPVVPKGGAVGARIQASVSPLTVELSTREQARAFYQAVYFASIGVPIQWTGSVASAQPGTTSAAFKDAVALRINWYRAMAGIPAGITFNETYSAKAQKAALMMAAQGNLSHSPDPSWAAYTADGAEAAANSNLALGFYGPESITALMWDGGDNNDAAGHRRWFLYPQTQVMGTGDIPKEGAYYSAQAVWVFDDKYGTTRPSVRDEYVAWPPKGYVPYSEVFPRWTFGYPGADFSAASVSVKRAGISVSTTTQPLHLGYGENTLVWFVAGETTNNLARPSQDVPYEVTLSNVLVAGTPRNFSYTVTVFDPDQAGAGETPTQIVGPAKAGNGQGTDYTITGPAFASFSQWRLVGLSSQAAVFGADGGLEGLLADVGSEYSGWTSAEHQAGSGAYHLTHLHYDASTQYLYLPSTYYVPTSGSPALKFYSKLGYAMPGQKAALEISLDEGVSWGELWSQVGNGSSGDLNYTLRSIGLSNYAGRSVKFRFSYRLVEGSYYYGVEAYIGLLLDVITPFDLQLFTEQSVAQDCATGSFTLTPSSEGTLSLQARSLINGLYPMEWGPLTVVEVVAPSKLVNVSVRAVSRGVDNPLILGFVVGGGSQDILLRGVGPSLVPFGVTEAVADPILNLFETVAGVPSLLLSNDDWSSSNLAALQAAFSSTFAFSLPVGSKDSALLTNISGARTAQSFDAAAQGIVLIEAYDAKGPGSGHFVNVSARNFAGTEEGVLIIGFSIVGETPLKLLIRGVGAELNINWGVPGVIANPRIELFQGDTVIASNDDWDAGDHSALDAAFTATYAFPLISGTGSSAMIVTLQPGLYTAQLKGVNEVTGDGLLEVYVIP